MSHQDIQTLLLENKNANTIEFAQEIYDTNGVISLSIPVDQLLDFYIALEDECQPDSRHFQFLKKGIANYEDAKFRAQMSRLLQPHIAHHLRAIAEETGVDMPIWLPVVFKLPNPPDATHAYTYLFNWSTVSAAHIEDRSVRFFELKLNGLLRERAIESAASAPAPQLGDNPQLQALKSTLASTPSAPFSPKKAEGTTPTLAPVKTKPNSCHIERPQILKRSETQAPLLTMTDDASIQHQLLTSMKYISLFKSATTRNKVFTLSLDDVARLLRERRCHYTGEILNTDHYEGEVPPDSYLSVDRVDNDLGYEPGNVVACAHWINKMKDRMSAEEFDQVLMMRKLMKSNNMSPEAAQLLAKMSAAS